MFTTYLLGLMLVTALILAVLAVAPRPNDDIRTHTLPVLGILVATLIAALALAASQMA